MCTGQLPAIAVKDMHGTFAALAQPHDPCAGLASHSGWQVEGHAVWAAPLRAELAEVQNEASLRQLATASKLGVPNPGSSWLPKSWHACPTVPPAQQRHIMYNALIDCSRGAPHGAESAGRATVGA